MMKLRVQGRDPIDGDISSQIGTCRADVPFSAYGLRACTHVDTSVPGNYTIDFMYRDETNDMTVVATRTLVVLQQCLTTQARCADLSCSDTSCAGGKYSEPANTQPRIALLPIPGATDGFVEVPKGQLYQACQAGQTNFASQPCEPGVPSAAGHSVLCKDAHQHVKR